MTECVSLGNRRISTSCNGAAARLTGGREKVITVTSVRMLLPAPRSILLVVFFLGLDPVRPPRPPCPFSLLVPSLVFMSLAATVTRIRWTSPLLKWRTFQQMPPPLLGLLFPLLLLLPFPFLLLLSSHPLPPSPPLSMCSRPVCGGNCLVSSGPRGGLPFGRSFLNISLLPRLTAPTLFLFSLLFLPPCFLLAVGAVAAAYANCTTG